MACTHSASRHDQLSFPLPVLLAGAVLIPCLYAHNLTVPFDFDDDGIIVYSIGGANLSDWFARVWQLVMSDFVSRGPFRPTFYFFHQTLAALLGPEAVSWRLFFLGWSMIAAGCMLWLMRELRIGALAALCATALAFWNFQRGTIWTHFGLTENIAMPFACMALVCALRAGRSSRPVGWDICGFACALVMLGTKNTFMAIVPVQVLLRIAPEGTDFIAGLRKHWLAAGFLASTLLLPFIHLFYFSRTERAYAVQRPTLAGAGRIFSGHLRAINLLFLLPALALAISALTSHERQANTSRTALAAMAAALGEVYRAHRAAFLAGGLLIVAGIVVYLPTNVGGGRYTMPGILGLDLTLATLLCSLFGLQPSRLKQASVALLATAMVVVGVSGWLKAERTGTWTRALTDALDHVERNAPPHAVVAWRLWAPEGQHFEWHLRGRGRGDVKLALVPEEDAGRETFKADQPQPFVLIGEQPTPPAGMWSAPIIFERVGSFGIGRRKIFLWTARRPG
jgi:hypothetical protein